MTAGAAAEQIYKRLYLQKSLAQWFFATSLLSMIVFGLLNQPLFVAISIVIGTASFVLVSRLPSDSRIQRWRRGAETEKKTSALLNVLKAEGFAVFEDVRFMGMRGNIDHIVVGPTGVWLLNSKYKDPRWKINWNDKTWLYGKYSLAEMVKPDQRLAAVLSNKLQLDPQFRIAVNVMWVLHGVDVPNSRIDVNGVAIVSPSVVSRNILHGYQELTWEGVEQIRRKLSSQLVSAAA